MAGGIGGRATLLPLVLFVVTYVFRISIDVPLGGFVPVAICSPGKSHQELMILMCSENINGASKWPAVAGDSQQILLQAG